MCPACAASTLLVIGGVISTGGVTAIVAKVLRKNKTDKSDPSRKEQ